MLAKWNLVPVYYSERESALQLQEPYESHIGWWAPEPGLSVPKPTARVCIEGTSKLISSEDIDGLPYTVQSCTPKASTSPARRDASELGASLVKKNDDLCGAPCTTYCNSGSGGPNPNDCTTLANVQSGQGTFTITAGTVIYWTYASCQVYMNDELSPAQDIVYCYSDWAGVVNYVAWNCQGTTGDNGGSCHFYDNTDISWIQVQTA
ncbi:hypothetical protein PHLGIDRAFT_118358 [Phlebiopsis gigantea 11061_1 CR5-6]|uniref:Uncharacterized protein n=1 Tax=Phlebiopsis gigantea (strain 11061_1 CR5-6) TaxID=745531 RepID=A0A0C3S821_PHLG1|nr:hypothetical protein PHLGIDRAFT_118358 [Phlebiopsis gigantea 11061_1 CR5-6]